MAKLVKVADGVHARLSSAARYYGKTMGGYIWELMERADNIHKAPIKTRKISNGAKEQILHILQSQGQDYAGVALGRRGIDGTPYRTRTMEHLELIVKIIEEDANAA